MWADAPDLFFDAQANAIVTLLSGDRFMRPFNWRRSVAALGCLLLHPQASAVDYPYANVGAQIASINISSGHAVPFNNRLLGLNTNFPENLYGLDGYNDADGQSLVSEWSPPALRFPHGVWSNFYDWEVDGRRIYDGYDGIYRDAVVNVPQLRYGFEGFNTLHGELGFDVLHTWNINYDSPEKGVRRLQDRRSKGFPVERIELGNETFWRNQRSEAVDTPEKYVAVARAHSQALKAEDPSIQLSVPVTWRTDGTVHGPWNAALGADQSYYDAVSLHRYVRPGESNEGLREVLDARRIVIDTAEDIRAQFPDKPIWLSEWSVDAGDNAVSVLGMSDVYLGLIERPDLFASAEYFQIHRHDPLVVYDKSANPKHVKTSRGAAYDILRDVFLGSDLLSGEVTTSQIVAGLDATSAQAVTRSGELVVYAVNKSPVSVPFTVAVDDSTYSETYTHHAMQFSDLNSTATYGLDQSALVEVASTEAGIVLPPLSISVISGFSTQAAPDYGTLIAGWDEWSAVSAATWTATEGEGAAVGVAETGGVWFNFNNATVENGASGDGRFGAAGPETANVSVAAATDGLSLSNGFDGHIDFTITDTQSEWRELTGFHFDAGAFRPQAAINWELEILPGGSLTPGVLASGTLTVNPGPGQDDETISLASLDDSVLDSGGSVTFRLSFSGGGGDAGSPALGHHAFLDNVAISALAALLPGDYNGDGVVDAVDYAVWRETYGAPAGSLPNDIVGGPIGIAQYESWREFFGSSLAQLSTSAPEPTTPTLSGVGIALLVACTRKRTEHSNQHTGGISL